MKTPFSKKLDSLLAVRGTAAKLADASGVPASHLSKLCKGVLPTPEMLNKLLPFFQPEDADGLVVEYLLLHRPAHARNVRILVSENDPLRDRLERAIAYLDPQTRESLASIVEAVNRNPEKGSLAVKSLGSLFDGTGAGASPAISRRGRLELLPRGIALSSEDTTHPPITTPRQDVMYGTSEKISGARKGAGSASAAALEAARAYEAANPPPQPSPPPPAAAGGRGTGRTDASPRPMKKPAAGREGTPEGNQ